ncbi:HNH endonuclease [Microbispora sp. H10885]|nr:HNH endonuclease [Microbispora sp. H10885]
MIDGVPELNVEKAHIYAANPGGARENEQMTEDELDDFPNIILLCRPHHKRIDGRRRDLYPPELLQEWKAKREGPGLSALDGLGRLTEDRLREILVDAHESIAERMHEAIERFEATDAEAAALLRALIDELAEARLEAMGLDPDLVTMLSSSSDQLITLGDYAPLLASAAEDLKHLPDVVPLLAETSRDLHGLTDTVSLLSDLAKELPGETTIAQLASAAYTLQNLPETVAHLESVVEQLRWIQGNM